ncbi:MAG: hypothetical protein O3A41_07430, partial [Bacteroidetes bacterium]|nr:hypothetical protein [Bacteroidota bacterium]
LLFIFLTFQIMQGQDKALPFAEIGPYPDHYSAQGVMHRLISGLGYRYYWASAELRPEDLNYRVSADSRSTREILEHIYGLSATIAATLEGGVAEAANLDNMTYEFLRKGTLVHLERAVNALERVEDFSELSVKIVQPNQTYEFEFWHLINGQISDAIWHSGQVVMNRRASGNPLRLGVNVFLGRTKL